MKKILLIVGLSSCLLFVSGICLAQTAPHELCGCKLGADINAVKMQIKVDTDMPVRYMESVHEVEIQKIEGFKSGIIAYGKCNEGSKILRIKLKYADASRAYYDQLLKRYEQRFGKPSEWKGDPFQVVIAWKWSFVDKQNHRISLILQHNTKDEERKMGNSVKLTDITLFEKEWQCFEEQFPHHRKVSKEKKSSQKKKKEMNWDLLIPH